MSISAVSGKEEAHPQSQATNADHINLKVKSQVYIIR